MALTANRDVKFYTSQELIELPVDDNVVIYKGALVGRNRSTGYARPLAAGDDFLGVAYAKVDNTLAGHTAGGTLVKLQQNVDVVHALSGAVAGDIGKDAYASADDTLTLTPTGNSRVGRVAAVEEAGVVRLRCQPAAGLSGVLENTPLVTLADTNTALTADHLNKTLLIANSTGRTLTLPAASSARAGAWVRVVKTNATAAIVTLDGNGAETIDGALTFTGIDALYDVATVLCTGSEWVIIGRDIA